MAHDRPIKGNTPVRQIGRVGDEEWAEIKSAAARSGRTFTRWAVDGLLTLARSGEPPPVGADLAGRESQSGIA